MRQLLFSFLVDLCLIVLPNLKLYHSIFYLILFLLPCLDGCKNEMNEFLFMRIEKIETSGHWHCTCCYIHM